MFAKCFSQNSVKHLSGLCLPFSRCLTLVLCLLIVTTLPCSAADEAEINAPFAPNPVEKTSIEGSEEQSEETLNPPATTNNEDQELKGSPNYNQELDTPEVGQKNQAESINSQEPITNSKKTTVEGTPLHNTQSIVLEPFVVSASVNTDLVYMKDKELSQYFFRSLQAAFQAQGFSVNLEQPRGKEDTEENTEQKHELVLVTGEIYSIYVYPINTITVAGLQRMNAKVEVSGSANTLHETSSHIFYTSKSFAGISNINTKASSDQNMQTELYRKAILQALDNCSKNLVRALMAEKDSALKPTPTP